MATTEGERSKRSAALAFVDGSFFVFSGFSALWLAYLLLREGARPGWQSLLLVGFWLVFSYLALPRLHRILTRLYLPGYFIGRTRTSDGLLGDPVNLAFLGSESQLHSAMTSAGFIRADDLTWVTGHRIVASTLRRRSYPQAPVSPLHLFDRQQDFAYQQEVAGSPSKRHHVRFWRCPSGCMLPGGYAVHWLAAGTYDRSVGLSLFTLQVTHKIDQETDVERDWIVDAVRRAVPRAAVETIRNFSSGYHSRNGGGDLMATDGDLPVLDLRCVEVATAEEVTATDGRYRRPAPTVFGAAVALLRGLVYGAMAVGLLLEPRHLPAFLGRAGLDVSADGVPLFTLSATAVLALAALSDLVLGLAVLRGRNWARLLLMGGCVLTTISTFVSNANGAESITLTHLPTVGTSILVLLALSSHRAREFALRSTDSDEGRPSALRTRSTQG